MEKINIKVIVATAAVGASLCGFAGGGTTVSLSPIGNAGGTTAQPATADSGETVKVQGRGVGADKDEALKNAYRDAVERAVGRYVDAEVAVANDQIIKKQILTQSNAYITDYQEIEEKRLDGGLVQLRILATVKKQALAKKLSGVMPTQTFQLGNEGSQIHAEQVTQGQRAEDAVALLKNVIDGIDPIKQLIRFTLAETKMLRKEAKGPKGRSAKEYCFYKFKFEVDTEKYYKEFLPPLLKVLDQISVERPKTVRFSRTDGSHPRLAERFGRNVKKKSEQMYLAGDWDSGNVSEYDVGGARYGINGMIPCDVMILTKSTDEWSLNVDCDSAGHYTNGFNCEFDTAILTGRAYKDNFPGESFQVVVITDINPNRTIVKARHYRLPKECSEPIQDWQRKLIGNLFGGLEGRGCTHYTIVFKDGNGTEVYSQPFVVENITLTNTLVGRGAMFDSDEDGRRRGGRHARGYGWYVTPMVRTDAKSFQRWIGFDIPLDDLPKIKAVTIELAD